jgi:hypothetical protein
MPRLTANHANAFLLGSIWNRWTAVQLVSVEPRHHAAVFNAAGQRVSIRELIRILSISHRRARRPQKRQLLTVGGSGKK